MLPRDISRVWRIGFMVPIKNIEKENTETKNAEPKNVESSIYRILKRANAENAEKKNNKWWPNEQAQENLEREKKRKYSRILPHLKPSTHNQLELKCFAWRALVPVLIDKNLFFSSESHFQQTPITSITNI